MNSLRELQLGFLQALFSRAGSDFVTQLVAGEVNGEQRLDIYRNNTFTNLRNALHSAYPVVGRLVGEDFFNYAATEYIYHRPSTCGDLHSYGDRFAEFLQTFPPAAGLPYLADVARLEWACHTAFFAADHLPLDLQRLAEVPVEQYSALAFQLHPACRLLESAYPIDAIWHVNQEDYRGKQEVVLDQGGVKVLVRRPRHHAEVVALTESEWCFLEALASGDSLGTASARALHIAADFDLAGALQRFVDEVTLVDFTLPSTKE
jgi:hypothetical protein